MKITAFNGSPRSEKGCTNIMVEGLLTGAKQAGAKIEHIFLAKKNIRFCLGCQSCIFFNHGECVIKDDMQLLKNKFIESDIVIIATPVYIDDMTSIMKNFIDRLFPIFDENIKMTKNGFRRQPRYKMPKILFVSSCGFPENSPFKIIDLYTKRIEFTWNTNLVGKVFRNAGDILICQDEEFKIAIRSYSQSLIKAGFEIVKKGSIARETQIELNKKIITKKKFLARYDKIIAKK